MSLLFRKLSPNITRNILARHKDTQIVLYCRKLSIMPSVYDGKEDPAPKFFSSNVQALLKRLTRADFSKVFRKRTNQGLRVLQTPVYKFLTDEELNDEINKTTTKANRLLQMPPVVKVREPINDVLSSDPALIGYDTAKYIFTDITFGVANEHRIIVERDPDGTLRSCDHDVRKRLNQIYFPTNGRKLKEPLMFTDEDRFNALLENEKYEFILDRACVQYEPDEPTYQRITSITFQHIDLQRNYNLLRSTRHFGPLAFYLTWHQNMDGLMLDILQSSIIREAALLTSLRHALLGDVAEGEAAHSLAQEILPTPVQLTKPERLSEEDIELDNKCIQCVETYIRSTSAMKSQHELALQGLREDYQQLIDLSRGLKKAHGQV